MVLLVLYGQWGTSMLRIIFEEVSKSCAAAQQQSNAPVEARRRK